MNVFWKNICFDVVTQILTYFGKIKKTMLLIVSIYQTFSDRMLFWLYENHFDLRTRRERKTYFLVWYILKHSTAEMSQWEGELKRWRMLRDQADGVIKRTLERKFPCSYATPDPDLGMSPRSCKKAAWTMGRALWVYSRSDLTIKTMQMKQADAKRK